MSILSSGHKSRSSLSCKSSKRKIVRFQLAYNLKSLLSESLNEKGQKLYEELVCTIRDAGQEIKDYDLLQLLKEARGCISILDENVRLFVQVLLIIKWTHRSEEVVQEYQGFLLDLCSAHNYYTKFALEQLVLNFNGSDIEHAGWINGRPNAEEEKSFTRLHGVIKVLLHVIPMSQDLLVTAVSSNFPYVKRSAQKQVSYIYNIFKILHYRPDLRVTFLNLIINKLLAIDVHAPRVEIEEEEECETIDDDNHDVAGVFTMEIENTDQEGTKSMKHPIANALDQCMNLMFSFIHSYCYDESELNWNRTKSFYSEMAQVFENVILPTHASHHVQFLLFYLLSFKSTLSFSFIQFLWKKVVNPNVPPIIRQASVSYIASLLARAKFIPVIILKEVLADFSSWIHGYISNQDGLEINCDCRIHSVFYSVCQALFYLIAFRHKDLVASNKGLQFLQGLNLAKVVTCRLNPLRVCLPAVTSHFASITRHYQLAYCYSVIEHNSRNTIPLVFRDSTGTATTCSQIYLDTYFPFDPYLLHRSNAYIKPLYRVYEGTVPEVRDEDAGEQEEIKEDEDDFLMEQTSVNNSCTSNFSYGTSPGFLQM